MAMLYRRDQTPTALPLTIPGHIKIGVLVTDLFSFEVATSSAAPKATKV